MKLLTEYLEHALTFERLAAEESNLELRAHFEMLATAYRALVSERAIMYGMPPPPPPADTRPSAAHPRARLQNRAASVSRTARGSAG